MGIFSRLSDIINSNINALLDKAEDPEKILRLMVQEMEDTLVELRTAAAKGIAERKERERFVSRVQMEIDNWNAKAELALQKDREDLARQALSHRNHLRENLDAVAKEIQLISEQLAQVSDDTAKLQAKLSEVKARQRTILLRHQHAEQALRARSQVANHKLDDIMQRFEYAERRVDNLEAQSEALAMGRQRNLAQQIAELEQHDKISAELAQMKSKLHSVKPAATEPTSTEASPVRSAE